jgi:protein-tyrosine phosphatase
VNLMPIRVLFVCLGNICRSPAAEAAFVHLAREAGRETEFAVDSAGTGAWHVGERADRRMRDAGRRRGMDVTSVARQVAREDFDRFDHIFAMDAANLHELRRLSPAEHHGKIKLYRDLDPEGSGEDVPDPYYGDAADFDDVLEIVTRTGREWLRELSDAGHRRDERP